MILYLPSINSNACGFDSLASLAAQAATDSSRQVEISFSRLSWFDANMAAPLGAVIARITDLLKTVSLVAVPAAQERILRKNRFLTSFGYPSLADQNRTTIPYQRFKLSEMGLFAEYLAVHLPGKGLPDMNSDLALLFQQSLFEIFNNAMTHSDSNAGVFVCGQFFPFNHRVQISLADAGVGIPHRIDERWGTVWRSSPKLLQDLQKCGFLDRHGTIVASRALALALAKDMTTKTGNLPGGAGLKIIKNFIDLNGGRLQIASGAAVWECSQGKHAIRDLHDPFPGTVINLEINTAEVKSYRLASPSK